MATGLFALAALSSASAQSACPDWRDPHATAAVIQAGPGDDLAARVRNNVVWNRAGIRLESGDEIMNVLDAEVYHNTVYSVDKPFSNIEYRWPNTRVILKNNLVSQPVLRRDGAQAELGGNLENAGAALFLDAAGGNLRLAVGSVAIDKGVPLAAGKADADMDGDARDGMPDAGAAIRREARGR